MPGTRPGITLCSNVMSESAEVRAGRPRLQPRRVLPEAAAETALVVTCVARLRWTARRHAPKRRYVAQQFRPSVPDHHLGREPRARDRLRRGWLPTRHPARA